MVQPSENWQRSWEFALRLCRAARVDPASPYFGRFVGVAQGRVVTVADSFEDLSRQLDELGVAPGETVMVDTTFDYDNPIQIWSCGE